MSRIRKGSARCRNGKFFVRVTLRGNERPSFELPRATDQRTADERAALVHAYAGRLRKAGAFDFAPALLRKAASCDESRLAEVEALIGQLEGGAKPKRKATRDVGETFRDVATKWTSGELARKHPDHVRKKTSAKDDVGRLNKHIFPHVGDVAIARFTLEHAEQAMGALPSSLAPATRRQVAQCMSTVLGFAVYPLKLIEVSPFPARWLPRVKKKRISDVLYPDEDRTLLACLEVPLCFRLLYGFIAREGLRPGEAAALTWRDVDLKRGTVRLDRNKTREPRSWTMSPGTSDALKAWSALGEGDGEQVFCDEQGAAIVWWERFSDGGQRANLRISITHEERGKTMRIRCARAYRHHLSVAGVDRPELFQDDDVRMPTRIHDLRGCFVTVALANGRSEAWVGDRTGHTTSEMINRYRRRARRHREAEMGNLAPLVHAIPELADAYRRLIGTGSSGAGSGYGEKSLLDQRVPVRGFEPRSEDSKSSVLPLDDTGACPALRRRGSAEEPRPAIPQKEDRAARR